MNRQYLAKKALPDKPGVYFFLGPRKEILYIGKATSLKSRTRSYFAPDLTERRGGLIVRMVAEAKAIDFRVTDSVLEAFLLEVDLIKKFLPRYNTKEKDDKSFNCVVITAEEFPRVLVIRKKDVNFSSLQTNNYKLKTIFGPFPHGAMLREALKIIRRIFPYRDGKCEPNQDKPCFNRQISLCPGVCTGEISKADYAKTVRNLCLFLSGKKTKIVRDLTLSMKKAAKARNFEEAGKIKKTLFALEHIQDVGLIKSESDTAKSYQLTNSFRIEAYDIAHISGTNVVGVGVVLEGGVPNKSLYRKYKVRGEFGNNETANLREVFTRRLAHPEWPWPDLFVADGNEVQKTLMERMLAEANLTIPVVAVTKDAHHRPEKILGDATVVRVHEQAILLANSEAHRFAIGYHRKLRGNFLR